MSIIFNVSFIVILTISTIFDMKQFNKNKRPEKIIYFTLLAITAIVFIGNVSNIRFPLPSSPFIKSIGSAVYNSIQTM